jgi:hypothetical protein
LFGHSTEYRLSSGHSYPPLIRIPGLMLHLDRNHHPSPLSPHANSNLILPTDQFKLLSRSPLAHDDKPAHQNTTVDLDATDTSTGERVVAKQPTPPPPVDEPVESHSPAETRSPTAPTASPNGHRSSSLSPPPDSGSPKPTAATSPLVVPEEPIEEPAPEPAEPSNAVPAEEPVAEEEAASPLSELSPAPEQEESFEDDKEDNTDLATSPAEVEEAEMTAEVTEIPAETEKIEAVETTEFKKEDNSTIPSEHTSPAAIPPQSPGDAAPTASTPVPDSESKTTSTLDPMSTDPTPNGDQSVVSKSKTATAKSPAKSPAPESSSSQEPRAASRRPSTSNSSSSGPPEPSKNKAERLLELNEELLKFVMFLFLFEQYFDSLCNRVCIEFQAHGIPMNELRFQEWVTFTQFDIF